MITAWESASIVAWLARRKSCDGLGNPSSRQHTNISRATDSRWLTSVIDRRGYATSSIVASPRSASIGGWALNILSKNVVIHAGLNDALVHREQGSLDASAIDTVPVIAEIVGGLGASGGICARIALRIARSNLAGVKPVRTSVSCNIDTTVANEPGGSKATLDDRARIDRPAGTAGSIAVATASFTTRELIDEADTRGNINRIERSEIT